MCTDRKRFYLVGLACGESWQLESLWNSEVVAMSECRTSDHFVLPVELGVPVTDEVWDGAHYPGRKK